MAQKQLSYGFSETLLQIDENTFVRVYNRQDPEIEFTVSGRKLSLSKLQWGRITSLSNNIQLAFTLLGESKIEKQGDPFEDIVHSLGL